MENSQVRPFLKQDLSFGCVEVYTETPPLSFLKLKQTHSSLIIEAHQLKKVPSPLEGDGILQLYDDEPPLKALAIVTADCVPIFLEGKRGVAALHAGWRGLAGGILKNPQLKKLEPFQAYLAPHIRSHQYEVSPDFSQNFPNSKNFFTKGKSSFFDLTGEVYDQLQNQFPLVSVIDSKICTYREKCLHSFRRNRGTGRNWNVWRPHT